MPHQGNHSITAAGSEAGAPAPNELVQDRSTAPLRLVEPEPGPRLDVVAPPPPMRSLVLTAMAALFFLSGGIANYVVPDFSSPLHILGSSTMLVNVAASSGL
ncbi:MAG: hypothetical protein AAGA93_26795, partial [Actinomycetota bacterium]